MEENKRPEEELEEVTPAQESASTEEAPSAEENPTEETVPAEPAGDAEEASPVEETPPTQEAPEQKIEEEKKVTPGKLALVIAAIVVLLAVIIALVTGGAGKQPKTDPVEDLSVETTEPAPSPTVPADGNPDDETCKGTYTVTDEEIRQNADTVVATIGEHKLTNGQLQVFYWMQVQNFLSSEYGSYMMYYGALDFTQPLDVQPCTMAETGTWQQFFLKEALNTWRNYCALADQANQNGLELTDAEKEYLAGMEDSMKTAAEYYGMESVEELLKYNVGAGAALEDYAYFQELLMRGNKHYDAQFALLEPSQEELEAFFAAHEADYTASDITRDGKLVNVRHILFTPEGGTTDESGVTTYSDEEWEACQTKAEDILNMWTAGSKTEESFAALATAMTQDPGSKETGGLYENVKQGQMVEAFDQWCFDEKREPGHNGMVKTEYGYHLMYFVGSTPIWEYYTRQDLLTEKSQTMMEQLAEQYPMEVDYSAITLGLVDLARG